MGAARGRDPHVPDQPQEQPHSQPQAQAPAQTHPQSQPHTPPQTHAQSQPQAPASPSGPAPAPPSPPAAHTNTLYGTPNIAGSTIQVGDVTNLHVHSAPAGDPASGQVPHPSPPPVPPTHPTPPTPAGRNSQPSGVIIRVEIGHQRYIEIFDEGLARYIINAHLKEMGLGHE
ncbi:hypothetical protein [Streptomyces acidicola]|uniref:hypothetical protein n=1 Tax=Streptomyces acidicola TaxID=2596892 RepID=UPI0034373A68